MAMSLFGRKKSEPTSAAPAAQSVSSAAAGQPPDSRATSQPGAGWSDIEAIRAEWPRGSLNVEVDRASRDEGLRLYQNDDYQSMMRCAPLLATAVAHSLYGEGILRGAELPETVHKIFYAALEAPPDGRTFADNAQKAARLALTIVRENAWQPTSMGGQG